MAEYRIQKFISGDFQALIPLVQAGSLPVSHHYAVFPGFCDVHVHLRAGIFL